MNTRDIGLAIVELGGGRRLPGDALDMRVGLDRFIQLGDLVAAGDPIAFVHAADEAAAERAIAQVSGAVVIDDAATPWESAPLVMAEVG